MGTVMAESVPDILRENLVTLAQTYATSRGIALTTLSQRMHGHRSFLRKYASGESSPKVDTYFDMVDWLRERWPPDLRWPKLRPIGGLGKKFYAP